METQKTLNSHINCKNEKQSWRNLTSNYATKLQLLRQYDTGGKTEIQINGSRQKIQRSTHTFKGTLSLTKEEIICAMEKRQPVQ